MEILSYPQARRTSERLAVVLAALLLVCGAPLAAQRVTAAALKAAFLFNFVNFIEWPAEVLAPGQRLSMCVIGDTAVADAVEQTIKGRSVDNHALALSVVNATDGPLLQCHLLYVGGSDAKRTHQLLFVLSGSSIFTVGDGERFAETGGVAQFIVENGRMRFAVNTDAARRAHLKISSKLLTLATIIKDPTDVPR